MSGNIIQLFLCSDLLSANYAIAITSFVTYNNKQINTMACISFYEEGSRIWEHFRLSAYGILSTNSLKQSIAN